MRMRDKFTWKLSIKELNKTLDSKQYEKNI